MRVRWWTAVLSGGLAVCGICFAARLTYAEYLAAQNNLPAVEHAISLFPNRADLHARVAMARPDRALDEWQVALALNAREAGWWQQLALVQELQGNEAEAEQSLLRAADVSHTYQPRWGLADFYYRHQRRGPFVNWARNALAITPGETEPIFQMARNLGLSSEEIRTGLLPGRPSVIAGFLNWAIEEGAYREIFPAGLRLLEVGTARDLPAVLKSVESLFQTGHQAAAVFLWNTAIERRWLQRESLDVGAGRSLVDGQFRQPFVSMAFGWRVVQAEGISMTLNRSGGGILVEATGKQSEQAELLSQSVALLPGRRYRLKAFPESVGLVSGAGLWWQLNPSTSGPQMMKLDESCEFEFTSAADGSPARLVLFYQRPLGATRLVGAVRIRLVEWRLSESGAQ